MLICSSRPTANLVQRWRKYHARIGLLSHLFHMGHACGRIASFHARYLKNESPLLACVWEPWGVCDAPLAGGNSTLRQQSVRCNASHCHTQDQPLHFVCAISSPISGSLSHSRCEPCLAWLFLVRGFLFWGVCFVWLLRFRFAGRFTSPSFTSLR